MTSTPYPAPTPPPAPEPPAETPDRPRGLAAVPAVVWLLVVLLLILAFLAGVLVGQRTAPEEPVPGDYVTDADDADDAAPPAGVDPEVAELAASVEPGTRDDGPQPLPDGTWDAQIWGPGGELTPESDIRDVHRRDPADPFALGALDAPLVISEFSDFECPFCSRFANTTAPHLVSEYVDTGLVRMEWNDLPVNGDAAVAAARAGRAAAEQGRFHEFKNALYAASRGVEGHPGFGIEDFMRFAEEAGMPDPEKFRADATGDRYDGAVTSARDYALAIGVNGTPGFLIGTQFVSGAQPTEVFERVITEELAKIATGQLDLEAAP